MSRTLAPSRRLAAGQRASKLVARTALGLVPIVVLAVLYQQLSDAKARPRVFPSIGIIWEDFTTILAGHGEFGSSYEQIAVTSMRIAAAFLMAFLIGVTVGIAAGRNKIVFSFVENLVWIFMAVPSAVWVFLLAVGLGLNPLVPPLAVAATVTPQFIVLVAEGAKSVPEDLVEMSRSYKTTKWQRLTGVFLPFLVPYILAASRTSFATAVKIMVVAEVIGVADGIGFEVDYWEGQLFMGPIVAWGLTLLLMGLLVDNLVFSRIERRVSAWRNRPVEAGIGGAA